MSEQKEPTLLMHMRMRRDCVCEFVVKRTKCRAMDGIGPCG
jgi:hypothetical protein